MTAKHSGCPTGCPDNSVTAPPSRWKRDYWGAGTFVLVRKPRGMGTWTHEVFCGGIGRGEGYAPGWYARTFVDGGGQFMLARRAGGGYGGTWDWEHEAARFDTAEEAIAAVRQWWDGPITVPPGAGHSVARVLHGDYVKTDHYRWVAR